MTSRWLPTLAALTAVIAALPLAGMSQPSLPMAEAHLAYRLGHYDRAVTLFGEAGAQNGEAQLWKGYAAFKMGQSEEAIAAWRVAATDPSVAGEAREALTSARTQMQALSRLLDRYGVMRGAGPGGPGAGADQWQRLAGDFDALAREAGESLVGRRAALMAADSLAYAGDYAGSISRFEAARDRHPTIGDWVLWRLAAIDTRNAADRLTELVAKFPASPLVMDARVALAETERDGDRRRAALLTVVREGGGRPAAERALFLLSTDPATTSRAGLLVRYWNTYPEGKYLDKVVAELAKLPGLGTDTLYRIASHYYFISEYAKAVPFFARVRSSVAMYRMGRSYWGMNELDRAVSTMKTVISMDGSLAGKAWQTIGEVEGQRKRWGPAVEAYNKAASFGGDAGVTARAALSRIYREQGRGEQARQLESSIISSYPWSEEATDILWREFWGAYAARRWQDAIVNGRRLAKHNPNHALGVAAQYWLGRLYERQGRGPEAVAVYKELTGRSPSTYYGWRAYWRERELNGRGTDPWFMTQSNRTVKDMPIRWHDLLGKEERELLAGATGTALPREMLDWPESVRELLFMRQFEIAEWYATVGKSPNMRAWMSYLQNRYRQAIREEKGEPRLNYPLGYGPLLLGSASRHGVDPLLLAALVREESRFDAGVKSWVGATGLAQLMPTTADWVFKQVPDVKGRPLTDPHCNLQLGGWYLSYTHRLFDGGSMYAIAAYNGGPGAVAKWKRNFPGGDPDEFVEAIPYQETRLYVKKVFSSYWNYVKLYGSP